MRNRILSLCAAVLAAASIGIGAGQAAVYAASPAPMLSAGPVQAAGSDTEPWIDAGCATGAFTDARVEQGHLLVPATITHCAKNYKTTFAFTIVAFRKAGLAASAYRHLLRPYAETGPTTVTADLVPAPAADGTTGLCLMRSEADRVACVKLETHNFAPVATPIPVDDQLVEAKVTLQTKVTPMLPSPYCATCLSIPE